MAMSDKPNFLILMVDQLSGVFFPDGPADFLKTPNLRALSDEAVSFRKAYCASPLCAPSRVSFMTGQLPSKTGAFDNAAEFRSSLPTFAHHLRAAGYNTILCGKMHFIGADQMHGFEQRLTTDIYPADFGWTPNWLAAEDRIDWWYHNLGSVTGAGTAVTTNQLEFDDEVAYHAKLKLSQIARQQTDRPFCLTVSFTHPHDPYVARQEYWDLYADDEVPMPDVAAIAYAEQDAHSRRLMDLCDWRNHAVAERHVRDARHAYFANVSYLDEQIGEILQTLEALRLADNTVIIFCADHGDMLGERGLWYKMSFFESSVRIPLMVHAPSMFASRSVDEPVSGLDPLPTLIELAGGAPADGLDGSSLVGLLGGGREPARRIASEYAAEGAVEPMVMIVEGDWKYVLAETDGAQLFDLATDPTETRNLVGDPRHQAIESSMQKTVQSNWDLSRFRNDVISSQQNRMAVDRALRTGAHTAWDFQPIQVASERYMRNNLDLNQLEQTARFPPQE